MGSRGSWRLAHSHLLRWWQTAASNKTHRGPGLVDNQWAAVERLRVRQDPQGRGELNLTHGSFLTCSKFFFIMKHMLFLNVRYNAI